MLSLIHLPLVPKNEERLLLLKSEILIFYALGESLAQSDKVITDTIELGLCSAVDVGQIVNYFRVEMGAIS